MRPAIRTLATLIRIWMMSAFVAAVLAMMGLSGNAQAGVVININQVGSDVVATGGGTINLTDLTYSYTGIDYASVWANYSNLIMGTTYPVVDNADVYTTISGPTSFGPGTPSYINASSGAGPLFGVYESLGYLDVPQGYVSGTLLSASDTYSGQTFSSLGLTPGTYTWTWGTGANADFFTVNIGTASVPEPSSLVLSGIAVTGAMAHKWRTRKAGRA
jgi:hypothetical protein